MGGNQWFNLTKFSLLKYSKDVYLVQGMHGVNNANIADIEGVVIHTKFMSDFVERVDEESKREEHFNNAMEYKIYDNSIKKNASLTLKNKNSVKLGDTDQFIKLGMMKCSDKYVDFIK